MAAHLPSVGVQGSQDELRTHFVTREGVYRLIPLTDYTKTSRLPAGSACNIPPRLSFVKITDFSGDRVQVDDLMCLNIHRELHVYRHDIHDKVCEIARPVEKKIYELTFPTCHDFNQYVASPLRIPLLVGFANGHIHLLNLAAKEFKKSFNADQLVEKTKVTCVRWVPGSENEFVVSHASGHVYVYDDSLPCATSPPLYQLQKQGLGFSVYTCKTKGGARNPKSRWLFDGILSINEVSFSPCTRYLAIVSQDGFLRVFNFQFQEVVGAMKSYFGGLRCACWSPDSKYIVTGGEDDLVTVWSLAEKRVLCRYRGHKSWVSVVAFDPYTTVLNGRTDFVLGASEGSEPAAESAVVGNQPILRQTSKSGSKTDSDRKLGEGKLVTYRFASVGEDTQLCIWELTEDNLVPYVARNRLSVFGAAFANERAQAAATNGPTSNIPSTENHLKTPKFTSSTSASQLMNSSSESSSLSQKYASLSISEQHQSMKEAKQSFNSLGSRSSETKPTYARQLSPKAAEEALKLLGMSACPQLHEVPMLDPLVCKKVAREQLTGLSFQEESIVMLSHDGHVLSWARPGTLSNGFISNQF